MYNRHNFPPNIPLISTSLDRLSDFTLALKSCRAYKNHEDMVFSKSEMTFSFFRIPLHIWHDLYL